MRGPAPAAVAAVAAGGALGCVLRAVLDAAFPAGPAGFPWAVFAINLVGAAALAVVLGLAVVRGSPVLAAFLGPGVLGGFTTLSAVSDQTRTLLAAGQVPTAAAYVGGSLALGLLAVHLVAAFLPPHTPTPAPAPAPDRGAGT